MLEESVYVSAVLTEKIQVSAVVSVLLRCWSRPLEQNNFIVKFRVLKKSQNAMPQHTVENKLRKNKRKKLKTGCDFE